MNDIAERTGFSRSTVSCVLNGRAAKVRIPDETQRRVLDVAAEMGYRHNQLARSVVWGKSRMLGFLTQEPGADVEFKSNVMVGAIEAAAKSGFTVQVLYLPPRTLEAEVVERCIEWRLAGVVTLALGTRVIKELHAEIGRHNMPLAVIEDANSYPWAVNVSSASEHGMSLALEHLTGLGHQRIAYLAASADDAHSQRRTQLFSALCRQRGLKDDLVFPGDWWQPEMNQAAAAAILDLPCRPTAVICCGDPAATALLNAAHRRGIRLPEELSVVGYGNYSFSVFTDPPLTTVSQPFRELGRLAVERLLETITDPHAVEPDRLTLPSSLVVRNSTAPAMDAVKQIST